ncbi:hypothetical protein DPMN_118251 [Dreissena polymorpha]|uniref:Carrier domain-containing protein n=1 Tax=Dreissena polymorpha TaxID=45954 RepID=A0A9D4GGK1_DREPO|nr:hypothetical protein DPMN_118251 [Dreissena polymorpha]
MMKHKIIVPSLWYSKENENPELKLSENGFIVPTLCLPWDVTENKKRQASVNSFGFGGTNAHVVVTEVSVCQSLCSESKFPLPAIVVISAQDEDSLYVNIASCTEHLKSKEYDLRSLSFTSTCKRDFMPMREVVFADNQNVLIEKLTSIASSKASYVKQTHSQPKIVFVFCGVGTVWQGMGQRLLDINVFISTINDIDTFLTPLTGWSVLSKISERSEDIIYDPCVSHIAIFTYQVALSEMWKFFGIIPDTVVGQSVGEVAAAYIGGYLDLPSAVKVIYYRSLHLASVNGGTMLIIRNVNVENVIQFCTSNSDYEIAVFISPMACTVACEKETTALCNHATAHWKGSQVIPLNVPCAYHSKRVNTAAMRVRQSLSGLQTGPPSIPMFSTVTGKKMKKQVACSGKYWQQNVRKPVNFKAAISKANEVNASTIYLEIGPSPVLKAHLYDIFAESPNVMCISSVSRNEEINTLSHALCQLFKLGFSIKWDTFIPSSDRLTDIPIQVLQKNTNLQLTRNLMTVHRTQGKKLKTDVHPFVKQTDQSGTTWEIDFNRQETLFLYEHKVQSQIIVPGALYTEVGFIVAKAYLSDAQSTSAVEVSLEFVKKVKLERENPTVLSVHLNDQETDNFKFQVSNEQHITCRGWVKTIREETLQRYVDIEHNKHWFLQNNAAYMTRADIYNQLREFGFEYGDNFKLLTNSIHTDTRGMLHVTATDDVLAQVKGQCFHPCLIDVMLQATITITSDEMRQQIKHEKLLFLPVTIGSIRVYKQPEKHMFIFVVMKTKTVLETVYQLHYDIVMVDNIGNKVAEILNYMSYSRRQSAHAPCELRYEVQWFAASEQSPFRKNTSSKGLRLLFLGRKWKKKSITMITRNGHTCIAMENAGNIEGYLENIRTEGYQAVIFYVGGSEDNKDINAQKASSLFTSCVENCLLITTLVKFCHNTENPLPMFIVGENTQTTSKIGSSEQINLYGSELWGFVRALNVESTRIYVSMVDTQPSFTEALETFMHFVGTCLNDENEEGHDTIVTRTQIFRARMCRSPRDCPTPGVRNEHVLSPFQNDALALMASERDMYLTVPPIVTPDIHEVTLLVLSAVVAPMLKSIRLQVIDDSMAEFSPVIAVEHEGYIVNNDNRNEPMIAIHPSYVKTVLQLPSACCMQRKTLKYHTPGLLTHVIAFTELASKLTGCSSVAIVCKEKEESIHVLLKSLIQSKTGLTASIVNRPTAKHKFDCAIAVEPLGFQLIMVPALCKRFLCFASHLKASERDELMFHPTLTVEHLHLEEIFIVGTMKSKLHDAVLWINKNHSFLSELTQTDEKQTSIANNFDCQEILLVDDKSKKFQMPIRYPKEYLFFKDAVYVVTGGLTGLGWEITKFLAENGAGNIALVARRSASAQQCYEIENVKNTFNCNVFPVLGDVTDIVSLQSAFEIINKETNAVPVRGIFHGAGVIEAKPLMKIDKENIELVLKPKILGTLHLHIVSRLMNLDYFVCASSICSFIGMPGQSSYGAANCFMDAFMIWRRQSGLPGQAINWGALSVGMAAQPMFVEKFEKRGHNLISIPELRSCFHETLMHNSTGTVYCDINWEIAYKDILNLPKINMDMKTIIIEVSPSALSETKYKLSRFPRASLLSLTTVEQRDKIQEIVMEIARRAIGGSSSVIKDNEAFVHQGFDSISRLLFTNVVHDVFGVRIHESELLADVSTIRKVIKYLHKKLFT